MKPGTLHKLTREARRVATAEGPAILKDIVTRAKAGDPFCQRLFMHYLFPRSKLVDEPSDQPPLASAAEAAERIAAIAAKMEAGELDLGEGAELIAAAQAYAEARKTSQLEAEVEELRQTVARLAAIVEGRPRS
jgi:hypothetical protein